MTNRQMEQVTIDAFRRFCASNENSIFDAYEKPSIHKKEIWQDIVSEAKAKQATDIRVVAHNCFIFTAGYLFPDLETGVLMFTYITPNWRCTVEAPMWID